VTATLEPPPPAASPPPVAPVRHSEISDLLVLRGRGFSTRIDLRATVLVGLLALITLAVGAYSLASGDFPVPLADGS